MDKKDIVDTLNTLIETSKDGEYGFRLSAEHAKSASIKQVFLTRAKDCAQAAAELQSLVLTYGGKAETDGTTTGSLHRGWVSLKGTLAGYSDLNMLEEAERGEDAALKRYRTALQNDNLPADVRSVVAIQFEGAQRNHNQIRELRNQAREMTT
ncbi:MAG TPA: PA2169 family four-helix-bundle protein [Hydrogenophaga sp.]|nr:PA2169 family four-helix-bundle protein [Hydrogenophaga sp.]